MLNCSCLLVPLKLTLSISANSLPPKFPPKLSSAIRGGYIIDHRLTYRIHSGRTASCCSWRWGCQVLRMRNMIFACQRGTVYVLVQKHRVVKMPVAKGLIQDYKNCTLLVCSSIVLYKVLQQLPATCLTQDRKNDKILNKVGLELCYI